MFLIILLLIVIIIFLLYSCNKFENFTTYYGKHCNSCGNKSFAECLKCDDCGICFDGETYKCMKGDNFGPYINQKYHVTCQRWYNGDPATRFVNENNLCVDKPYY